jgi:hypothetical protein
MLRAMTEPDPDPGPEPEPEPPAAIVALAEERSRAREERRWARADELRTAIEAAGWRVEDVGTDVRLSPALPPDVVVDGQHHYGSVASVPSRLAEAADTTATIAVLVGPAAISADALLTSLEAGPGTTPQVVVVVPRDVPLAGPCEELVRTAVPFSAGDALQAALRRSRGELIIVLSPDARPTGDLVAPLQAALADSVVAIAGSEGVASADLRRFHRAPHGAVAALRSGCYAFRRGDAIASGPIDGRLQLPDSVAVWLSLALRDRGPDQPPRLALSLALPLHLEAPATDSWAVPAGGPDVGRKARRDGYRIAERYAARTWLASPEDDLDRVPGDGPDGHDDEDEGRQREHAAEA